MQNFRIIEIPPMKVACSGPIRTMEQFSAFNEWFSAYHAALKCELAPRDFMWYNEKEDAREWIYALPDGASEADCGGFKVETFPFGLYAVGVCRDADLDEAADWLRTRQEIRDWVRSGELFRLHENGVDPGERYDMFRIVSPGWLQQKGYCTEDMYVPIYIK